MDTGSYFYRKNDALSRIRQFRADRLAQILAEETPLSLSDAPKIVLHLVPIGAFNPAVRFDVTPFAQGDKLLLLQPLTYLSGNIYHRYNFDGLVRYEKDPRTPRAAAYVQLFHNGIIEAVDAYLIQKPLSGSRGSPYVPEETYERTLLEAFPRYLAIQEQLGVQLPVLVLLSLLGVKDHFIALRDASGQRSGPSPIDRANLLVPEVQLDALQCNPAEALRPLFDAVANAGGWPQAQSYDAAGIWTGLLNPGP